MRSVFEKIHDDDYTPEEGLSSAEWRARAKVLDEQFKRDCLEEVGYLNHPKAELLWKNATENTFAYGHLEVFEYLQQLVKLIEEFIKK